jgi:hypothetical protein
LGGGEGEDAEDEEEREQVDGEEREEREEEDLFKLPPPRTGNQRLAVQYRRQYAKVLEAAMDSLAGEDWGTSAVWRTMSG